MQYIVSCIRILSADEHFVCMKWDIFHDSLKKNALLEWGKFLTQQYYIQKNIIFIGVLAGRQTCDSLYEKTMFQVNTEYSFKVNMLNVTTL